MITEKSTIKCEAVFSEDHTHRFLWERVWEKSKPIATVIMLNPCDSDGIITDTTTTLVVNNVARLEEFGGVAIVNLYSMLTSKLNFRWNADSDLNHEENDGYIMKAAEEASKVILAWGRAEDTNKRVEERVNEVLGKLSKHKEKLFVISDGAGRYGMHPLTPALRNRWYLESYESAKKKRKEQEVAKAELLAKAEAERKKANEERLDRIRMQFQSPNLKPNPVQGESAIDATVKSNDEQVPAESEQENLPDIPSATLIPATELAKTEETPANETVTEA